MKILLVEDDEVIAKAIADVLTQQQYVVDAAIDGEIGWLCAKHGNYDLILLDVMLPKLDGISLCQQLRQTGQQMPILLLTAKDTTTDKVLGLDSGADDYLIKPFEFSELTARIRALLRRGSSSTSPILEWGNLQLDPSLCKVTYRDRLVNLTSTEYRVLELFLRNSQRTFSRSAIVDHLWNLDDPPQEATIKSYIKTLRQKLTAAGAPVDLIETVYGLGYRLNPSEAETSESSIWIEQQTELAVQKARESFGAKLSDRFIVLEQAIAELAQDILNDELCQKAEQESHKLAGALGTFGFTAGSRLAEALEDIFQAKPTPDQASTLNQLVIELRQMLNQVSTPEPIAYQPLLLVLSQDLASVDCFTKEAANWQIRIASAAISSDLDRDVEQELIKIVNQQPDGILLDLDSAPSFQAGLTLLSELLEQPFQVFVWTERESLQERVEIMRQGGDSFLSKSLPTTAILQEVAQRLHCTQTQAKVLLVDDDPQVLSAMRSHFGSSSLELTTLETPTQFWNALLHSAPDLLILDVEMPEMNGIDLCRVIRSDPRWHHLPVLFLTVHTDADTVDQMFAAGATDCVSKSVSESSFFTRMLNCLERKGNTTKDLNKLNTTKPLNYLY
ncbi:MAG: response regulator [Leptolyngbyaceae cyanobacterium CSU_1_3]|nr:response regulator [Leptolyngbyaceae cyanobacterium CSU_1_3]